jgi:hypothetical protein
MVAGVKAETGPAADLHPVRKNSPPTTATPVRRAIDLINSLLSIAIDFRGSLF